MSQTSTERLRDYLAQLPPQSQALLMREYERAIERGEDAAVAQFVLEQLRQVVRGGGDNLSPRSDDPARLLFRPLEPFLTENDLTRPGQVRRSSLPPIWQWLSQGAIADEVRAFESTLAGRHGHLAPSEFEPPVKALQIAASDAIIKVALPAPGVDSRRALARIGSPSVIEDLASVGAVLKHRDALDALHGRLPGSIRMFGESQISSTIGVLNVPTLQTPQLLPFALSLVMQRMAAPWQIIRLAIKIAGSDDEVRVAGTSYGVAVAMAIHDIAEVAARLRSDIRRGQFGDIAQHLKTVHDGIRGIRTELDIRNDSAWGRQVAAIRVDVSGALQSEIESVPGRVRRLLRQRADRDILVSSRLDDTEVDEVAALIDFVATCRTYASELAINEVTMRTYSELQHYVETSTESLVQALRSGDVGSRAFRQMQARAAIRFCEVLFGQDYAALMGRAADNATAGIERRPTRAG
jgi:hypothetical protein